MSLRTLYFSLFFIVFPVLAFAQDVLYKKDKTTQKVTLLEITNRIITYKEWGDVEDVERVIDRRKVTKIKYQNGQEELLAPTAPTRLSRTQRKKSAEEYGRNVICVSPIFMANTSIMGVGMIYERFLGNRDIFSFSFPVAYSFDNENSNTRYSTMLWMNPGGRFYATTSSGKARFGMGPSLFFGLGHERYSDWIFSSQSQSSEFIEVDQPVFIMGAMANFSLNFQPSPKLVTGFDLGLGVPFVVEDGAARGTTNPTYGGAMDGDFPLVNFHFKIGYRF
ncbi:MAG TPA: hypothetical protein VL098_06735 [Flavipsychrobacter sp.]|nr:hypothetical protein [Flavipsychrobacter sp.]